MLLTNVDLIHINAFNKPSLAYTKHDIVPRHLPLPHAPILRERPMLQTITPLPGHTVISVAVFIPELHGDLVVGEGEELFAQRVLCLFLPFLC
jgi:hypothetical protein